MKKTFQIVAKDVVHKPNKISVDKGREFSNKWV